MGEIAVPSRDRPYCNVGGFGAICLGNLNLKHQLNGLGKVNSKYVSILARNTNNEDKDKQRRMCEGQLGGPML